MNLLLVGVGGFLGAIARYALSGMAQRLSVNGFPLGTLTVNTLGCLAIGFVGWLVVDRPSMSDNTRLFISVGFLGSLTTFSAFSYETLALIRDELWLSACTNIALNVALGLLAVVGGWASAKTLLGS